MRIAIVTDAWHPQINGVVITHERVNRELERLGHELTLIEPSLFRTVPMPTYPEIRLAVGAGRKVAAMLDKAAPDAVHVATEGPLGWAARRHCLHRGWPFTTTYHTRFPEYIRLRFPVPLSWGYRFVRWFHGAAARTLVTTPSMERELESRGLGNLAIWTRGVDTQAFKPVEWTPRQERRFVYMGRVAIEKNVEAFLQLDLPGSKIVIGSGPDLATLRRRYPQVFFTGYVSQSDLPQRLASADVFVFPSRTDTFGLVLLEAMACGVPVAAYPVAGPRDIIQNGVNGYMDEDLKHAALKALEVDRTACRRFALDFSWEACSRQFLEHLEATRIRRR